MLESELSAYLISYLVVKSERNTKGLTENLHL